MARRLAVLALALFAACASSSLPRTADPPPGGGTSTATVTVGQQADGGAVEGRLSKAKIGGVIRSQLRRFVDCYALLLAKGGSQTGVVKVRFVIAPTGKVSEATITASELHHPRTESCIVDAMRSLDFPPPQGGGVVVVTYPFTFDLR